MALTNKQKSMVSYIRGTRATAPAEIADQHPELYNPWVYGEIVVIGDRRRDEENGLLYEVHAPAGTNLFPPHQVPAVWKRVFEEDWPDWVQPLGAHDAYAFGAKVKHNGKKWTSDIKANVYEPGVYGWSEYIGE